MLPQAQVRLPGLVCVGSANMLELSPSPFIHSSMQQSLRSEQTFKLTETRTRSSAQPPEHQNIPLYTRSSK